MEACIRKRHLDARGGGLPGFLRGIQSFSVTQVAAGYRLKNAAVDKLNTYRKFGVPAPAALVAAASNVTFPHYLPVGTTLNARSTSPGTVSATPGGQYESCR